MSTIKMKAEEVIEYCEKAIVYWMAERENEGDIAPNDACIEFKIMIMRWRHEEIKKAEDLIGLAKLSPDTIDVGSDILEIIETSKQEFKPKEKDWWKPERFEITVTKNDVEPEKINSGSWTGH